MTRTVTLPPTDKTMWRKARARAHPDAGGDHELFIWLGSVEDLVCSGGQRRAPDQPPSYQASREEPTRVPYATDTDFEEATRTALRMGSLGMPYGRLLSLLADCRPLDHLDLQRELGRLEGRLEITETAESTLRAELERERERAETERARADQERERVEDLRRELEAERSRGFWRRLFGG